MQRREFLIRSITTGAFAASAKINGAAGNEGNELASSQNDQAEMMATIRVYGSILYATGKWRGGPRVSFEPSVIASWMKDLAEHGVTTVLWRANCAGTLTYPSQFTGLAGEPPLPDPNRGMGVAEIKQGWPAEDWEFLGEQCRRFHTLQTAVEAAHQYGLKIFLDFHTFDMVGSWCTKSAWPDGEDRSWNPDWWLWSKDQQQRLAGIPCYADPLLRHRRVAEIAEALETGIDGVSLGFFSHCDGLSGDQTCHFGYNQIVVEEYRKRFGDDPLTGDINPHQLYALHGEYFTRFVQEASDVVHAERKKLLCTTRVDGIHGWGGAKAANGLNGDMSSRDLRDGTSILPLTAGFYLEWEKWARDNLVDGLVCSAPYQKGVQHAQTVKQTSELPVFLWRKYTGFKGRVNPPLSLEDYRNEIETIREEQIGGYCLLLMQITQHEWFQPDWRDLTDQ